jgi:tetratricopeptide (TPR) repeat protein
MYPSRQRLAALSALFLAVASANAVAADSSPPPAPAAARVTDPLASARAAIKAQRWPAAISELQKLNATDEMSKSADWHNLMGYSMRKQATPDLAAAQRHYDEALRINPAHQGALEYSGELALMKGDLPTAETRLAALSKLCSSPCEPLDDLKKSIAKYKASGKS